MPLARLVLTDFRNHREALLAPGPGLVVLTGENGAGKTNVLEAVSLLSPGRGLRGAPLSEMARTAAAAASRWRPGSATWRSAPARRSVRSGAAPGADQRRRGLGDVAFRMAVRALADPGHGPAVPGRRGRAAAVPRPAGAGARAGPRRPRRPLRSGDAGPQQAARGGGAEGRSVAVGAGGADGGAWRRPRRRPRARPWPCSRSG